MELFFFTLTTLSAASCMVITSSQSAISMRSSEIWFCAAVSRMVLSFPVKIISTSSSCTASAQPLMISSGALSPPNASTMIFIIITHIILLKKFI